MPLMQNEEAAIYWGWLKDACSLECIAICISKTAAPTCLTDAKYEEAMIYDN